MPTQVTAVPEILRFQPMLVGSQYLPRLEDIAPRLLAARVLAIDCETSIPLNMRGETHEFDKKGKKVKISDGRRKELATDFRSSTLVGVSFTWKEDAPPPEMALPVGHPYRPKQEQGPWYPSIYLPLRHALFPEAPESWFRMIQEILRDPTRFKVFHQAPFDIPTFDFREGWQTVMPWLDTMLAAWVYDENEQKNLKDLGELYLGWQPLDFKRFDGIPFDMIQPDVAYPYACQDTHLAYRLMEFYYANLYPEGIKLLHETEMPTQEVFLEMSRVGIPVDAYRVRSYQGACEVVVDAIDKKIRQALGQDIKPTQRDKMLAALRSLGLMEMKNYQKGTLQSTVHEMKHADITGWSPEQATWRDRMVELLDLILLYKKYEKINGTPLENLLKFLWPDQRIRPQYYQWFVDEVDEDGGGAVTGRSSCKKPGFHSSNRSRIPLPGCRQRGQLDKFFREKIDEATQVALTARAAADGVKQGSVEWYRFLDVLADQHPEGPKPPVPGYGLVLPQEIHDLRYVSVKDGLVAPNGYKFVTADASQIEPRTSAAITGEPWTLDIFERGASIYKEICAGAWGGDPDDYKKEGPTAVYYQAAKRVFLSRDYLAGKAKILEQLHNDGVWDATLDLVEHVLEFLDQRMPLTRDFEHVVAAELEAQGFVQSITGRRRRFPFYHRKDHRMRRQARNFKVQNPAFDHMKRAMIRIFRRFRAAGMVARLCGQIHDEVICICPDQEVDRVAAIVREEMIRPMPEFPHPVPLDTEVQVGQTLGDMRAYSWEQPAPAPAPTIACRRNGSGCQVEDARPMAPLVSGLDYYRKVLVEALPCRKCVQLEPFGWQKVGFHGRVDAPVSLAWVSGQPTEDDVLGGRPFRGRLAKPLIRAAADFGLPMPDWADDCWAAHCVWCHAPKSDNITPGHVKNCRPFLDRVMEVTRPRFVVACGSLAMRAVLQTTEAGLEKKRGKWYTLQGGAQVMVTFNPAQVELSPGYEDLFRQDLHQVRVAMSNAGVLPPLTRQGR